MLALTGGARIVETLVLTTRARFAVGTRGVKGLDDQRITQGEALRDVYLRAPGSGAGNEI
jgi:hypothetical protein